VTSIATRMAALPRATRWGIIGLIVVAGYFVVIEPVVDATSRVLERVDSKSSLILTHSKTAQAMRIASETLVLGVKKFGVVSPPGDPEKRPLEFSEAVDRVLKSHDVKESTSTSHTAPLGAGPLSARIGGDFRVERLLRDIQFAADPDSAAAVIADLERLPVVATISRLQIRQAEGKDKNAKMVRVTMTLEAWLQARKGKK